MQPDEKINFLLEVSSALKGLSQDSTSAFGFYQLDSACYSLTALQEDHEEGNDADVRSEKTAVSATSSMAAGSPPLGCCFKSAAFRCMGEKLQDDGDIMAAADQEDVSHCAALHAGPKQYSDDRRTGKHDVLEEEEEKDCDDEGEDSSVSSEVLNFNQDVTPLMPTPPLFPTQQNVTEQPDDMTVSAESIPGPVFVPDIFALVCHPSLQRSYPVSVLCQCVLPYLKLCITACTNYSSQLVCGVCSIYFELMTN